MGREVSCTLSAGHGKCTNVTINLSNLEIKDINGKGIYNSEVKVKPLDGGESFFVSYDKIEISNRMDRKKLNEAMHRALSGSHKESEKSRQPGFRVPQLHFT